MRTVFRAHFLPLLSERKCLLVFANTVLMSKRVPNTRRYLRLKNVFRSDAKSEDRVSINASSMYSGLSHKLHGYERGNP